jgi:hypothetical protein
MVFPFYVDLERSPDIHKIGLLYLFDVVQRVLPQYPQKLGLTSGRHSLSRDHHGVPSKVDEIFFRRRLMKRTFLRKSRI